MWRPYWVADAMMWAVESRFVIRPGNATGKLFKYAEHALRRVLPTTVQRISIEECDPCEPFLIKATSIRDIKDTLPRAFIF